MFMIPLEIRGYSPSEAQETLQAVARTGKSSAFASKQPGTGPSVSAAGFFKRLVVPRRQ